VYERKDIPPMNPEHYDPPRKCSDCGLTPIPRLDVVWVGRDIMCTKCAHQAPKRITLYVTQSGHIWWNSSAGGEPVEYVRADLTPDAPKADPRHL
jgi:hypothetical protein